MGDSAFVQSSASIPTVAATVPRHSGLVRITHWITTLCFLALLVSGIEILISHPRFYWGESGNVLTDPLFKLPIPASRHSVPTGYGYVLHDQNGWSRYLHFQSAWVVVLTGFLYVLAGLLTRHFEKNLLPQPADRSWAAFSKAVGRHVKLEGLRENTRSYNLVQRLSYALVIFVLFPLIVWTGLAMSPAFVSAFPATVTVWGGQQSARTLHFFITIALTLFLLVHVAMVIVSGFRSRMRAMITGGPRSTMEDR